MGGPIDAIVGELAGAWARANVHEETGTSGNAYLIRLDDGTEQVFRSPNFVFKQCDKVEIEGSERCLQKMLKDRVLLLHYNFRGVFE